ncbi:MAG: hypothetical protein CVV01_03190, partial [Firmicutes bacterium HGW-Firmicutes-6]
MVLFIIPEMNLNIQRIGRKINDIPVNFPNKKEPDFRLLQLVGPFPVGLVINLFMTAFHKVLSSYNEGTIQNSSARTFSASFIEG